MVLTFVSADEIPKCDHSMKSTEHYFPVMLLTMQSKVVLTFESADEILKCWSIQMKATVQCYHETLFILQYKVVQTFVFMDVMLKCDHLNESYSPCC